MTRAVNAVAWGPPRNPGSRAWLLKALGLVIAGLTASQYLAACLLLASLHLDVRSAGPLTIARYAYYYGDRANVRARLWIASALGLALVGLGGAVVLMPRRRALHGDARFATRGEVARAGLLGDRGIILGRWGRRYLMLAGQQGVCLAAPPARRQGDRDRDPESP